MMSFFSDRILLSTLLYSIAVLIAFGPELRLSLARTRTGEPRPADDAADPR